MKKLKKFIKSKGGIVALIGGIGFVLIIPLTMFLSWGIEYNWNWDILIGYFTNEYAITGYIVAGLVLFAMVMFYITIKLKEDI